MFQCDCFVVDVDLVYVGFVYLCLGQYYGCECFVDFDDVDVVDFYVGFFQYFCGGLYWVVQVVVGFGVDECLGDDLGLWGQVVCMCYGFVYL